MMSIRTIAISVLGVAISTSLLCAQDLSKYREFNLATNLPVVAKQLQVKPSVAKTIHQRPAVIQELDWQVPDRDPFFIGDVGGGSSCCLHRGAKALSAVD